MLETQALKTVLIVEDDDVLRDRLARSMQRRGFNTRTAASVAQARAAIADDAPEYMITDLRLQDGSGLSVVETLETRRPDARAIVLTGYGDIATAVAAVRLGAVDYIAKPASAEEIAQALTTPNGEHPPAPDNPIPPDEARWEHIEHVYAEAGENVSKAAHMLNLHRRTLQRILRRHGVSQDAH